MRRQQGFTLLEVLIAVVILAVGLLGTAALSLNSLQTSQGASLRSQASAMAADFAERLRTNRDYAISAAAANTAYALASGAGAPTNPTCASSSAGCDGQGQAQRDMYEWRTNLDAAMPGASAVVTKTDQRRYELTLTWNEAGNRGAATSYRLRIDL